MNIYALAERLHCPVSVIRQMPAAEYHGWLQFYKQSEEDAAEKDNPLKSGDAMLKAFGL